MKRNENRFFGKVQRFLAGLRECPAAMLKELWRRAVSAIFRPTRRVLKKCLVHTPVDPNTIVFMSNTGRYTCNPKYIYEELKRRGAGYRLIWIRTKNEPAGNYPADAEVYVLNSLKSYRAVFGAKVWIDNGIAFSNHFEKKPNQIHIQTMHGSLGIKRMDNAVKSRVESGERGRTVVRRESQNTNYVITNSAFEEGVFRSIFWKDTPMVRLGHARTDILFPDDTELGKEIRRELMDRYQIPMDKKIAMYGPTHRRGLTFEDINIDYPAMIQALQTRFGGEFVVLLRLHDRIRNIMLTDIVSDSVFDVTDYPDMQRLMKVCDVGITDYSSWIYDYVLTGCPGFIYATDLERYNNNTGLYYPLEETPFPVCKNNEQLQKNILNFDMERFQRRRIEFLEDKQSIDDGSAAARIADWLMEIAPAT